MAGFVSWLLSRLADGVAAALLLAAAAWLARLWIKARLTASIRLETETQLARVKAEIKAAETRISAVTSAGITAIGQMSAATIPARVTAVQTLWDTAIRWRRASFISAIIAVVDIELLRRIANDAGTRAAYKKMLDSIGGAEFLKQQADAESARPFVSERAWALFLSLHNFLLARMTKATLISVVGAESERAWHLNTERSIIVALQQPDLLAQFDQNASSGSAAFVGYVETELMAELKRNLSGMDSGPEASRHAAVVIETVTRSLAALDAAQNLPGAAG
jgi:hypothetical protein